MTMTGQQLTRRDDSWPDALPAAKALAGDIARTEFVPRALRGNAPAVLACVMTGRELGLGPMQSLQSIHVVDGRPTLSAELMRALVLAAGHRVTVRQMSAKSCTVWGRRADSGDELEVTWTIEQAQAAGVADKSNWKAYPDAMLLARATSALCRALFPDVLAGVSYTPDELDQQAAPGAPEPVRAAPEPGPDAVEAEVVEDTIGETGAKSLNVWLRETLDDTTRDRMRRWWADNDLPIDADSGRPDIVAITPAQRDVVCETVTSWLPDSAADGTGEEATVGEAAVASDPPWETDEETGQ